MNSIVRQREPFRWDGVPLLAYKADPAEARFEGVTRQVLFDEVLAGIEAHIGSRAIPLPLNTSATS